MEKVFLLRLSKSLQKRIQQITLLDPNLPENERVVYKKNTKKKEMPGLKPLEKATRQVAEANQTFIVEYLRRHNRSRSKKKSGWLKDLGENVYRSQRKALKKLQT